MVSILKAKTDFSSKNFRFELSKKKKKSVKFNLDDNTERKDKLLRCGCFPLK